MRKIYVTSNVICPLEIPVQYLLTARASTLYGEGYD